MKKHFLTFASAVLLLAACNNSGSSTIGEQDKAYGNSFHSNMHEGSKEHTAPADHKSPADHKTPANQMHTGAEADSLHKPAMGDTTHK